MPNLTNRLKLALPNGNEYVNRVALNKIFEDIDRLVMLQGDFDTAKKEIDDNLAKKVAKSGDTMTGPLLMQASLGFEGDRNIYRKQDDGNFDKGFTLNKTNIKMHDWKNNRTVWDYEQNNNMFNMIANTNLVKSNEIYKEWTLPSGTTKQLREGDDLNTIQDPGLYGGPKLVNAPNQDYLYIEVIKYNDANYVLQRATTLTGTTTGRWERRKTGAIWSDWEAIIGAKGGTMTGPLNFKGNQSLQWLNDADSSRLYQIFGTPTSFGITDIKGNQNLFSYDSATKRLNFNTETNLLKKSGDTMTGDLTIDRPNEATHRNLRFHTNNIIDISIGQNTSGKFLAWDQVGNTGIWEYDKANKSFNVTAPNTNLLRKTGDIATGEMTFRHNIHQQSADGKTGIVSVINLSQTKWAVGPRVDGAVDWSKELSMSLVTGEVSVAALKVKGERALTISDAEEKTPSRSGKDENGIFTTYEETQEDGKLWKRSVLSSPDADGNYLVRTVTYYKDGVAYKTKVFDLKYDEDGDFVKAVPR